MDFDIVKRVMDRNLCYCNVVDQSMPYPMVTNLWHAPRGNRWTPFGFA